jgi:hypothetical protein
MLARFAQSFELDFTNSSSPQAPIQRWTALPVTSDQTQVDVRLHLNPQNLILHTVLVWSNGFIHGATAGTADAASAGRYLSAC